MREAISTRERILKAAYELISSRGYMGATTKEIAQIAQVAEVTLFRHFTSKENLFSEVLSSFSSLSLFVDLLPQLGQLPYEEVLEVLILQMFERFEENRTLIRVWTYEVQNVPENIRKGFAQFLKRLISVFTEFFQEAQSRGLVRADLNPEYASLAFHSIAYGFFQVEERVNCASGMVQLRHEMISTFAQIIYLGTRAPI